MKTINLLGVMGLQLKFVNELKVLIMKAIKHILLPRQLSISKSSIIYRVGQKERSLDVS